jgi:ribosomal-protein-alanine N-acetyltransferase
MCLPENYTSFFFIDIHRNYPESFVVAEKDSTIIGYMMCRIEKTSLDLKRMKMRKNGHVISIAVLPEHRNTGIGQALIREALKALSIYEAEECYLEVRVSNTPAINLYKKAGFEIARTVHGYYVDGENAYLMKIRIPKTSETS